MTLKLYIFENDLFMKSGKYLIDIQVQVACFLILSSFPLVSVKDENLNVTTDPLPRETLVV